MGVPPPTSHKKEEIMTRTIHVIAIATLLLACTAGWAQAGSIETSLRSRVFQRPSVGKISDQATVPSISPKVKAHVFKFTTIDFPGASFTQVMGNATGLTVGNFSFSPTSSLTPFTFKGGAYKTLTVPGSIAAHIFSVNSKGQVVGDYIEDSGVKHGFVDTAGVFVNVDFPGSVDTSVSDINTSGDVVGTWGDEASVHGIGKEHGFIQQQGAFTSIDFPGAALTAAMGINANDDVVGIFFPDGSDVTSGFLLKNGVFTRLNVPLSTSTLAVGVNDSGQVSGSYEDANGTTHGFLFSDGVFTTVDVFGAAATALTHIPNSGPFAGTFTDQLNESHGLTAR
jgi:probable HAF family extracellular repeat protein